MIRIGPAGWSYADWAGTVYPDPAPRGFDPLRYLARYFSTVEINSSFYGPPAPDTAKAWLERVEANAAFRFTAKIWRRFTHERRSPWSADDVRVVRAGFEPLLAAGRLGAVLLQFPWSFRDCDENRDWLRRLVSTFPEFPLVVEVRHATWQSHAFFDLLDELDVGFVNVDQPLFHHSVQPSAIASGPVGYVRVHGRNYGDWWSQSESCHERYDYLYTTAELKPWADRATRISSAEPRRDVYVVTSNHYRGKSVANALMLDSMIHRAKVDAPPPVVSGYGAILEPYATVADVDVAAGQPPRGRLAVTSAGARYPARRAGLRSARGA